MAGTSATQCRPASRGRQAPAPVMLAPLVSALLAVALLAAGCSDLGRLDGQAAAPSAPKQAELTGPGQREHQRILAAYGGAYQDARIEALINKTVERLVAASERPDLRYRVTILNSPAVNAFALPTGQLYVSRGLIALANDTSELASVLSHEMAHVIARHAAIREDQARQAALVSRVASDVFNDPQMGAMALAKSKIALATFSRGQELEADGIGVGISSRAGYDPYGAVRFLNSMGRNAEFRPTAGVDPRYLDFLSSHPATPDRMKIAQANARQYAAPGAGDRDAAAYMASIDGLPYGEDPSEGYVRGRRFLHPRLGFTFMAPEGFSLDNTAQAVLGVKDAGNEALRLDVVRVPAEQTLPDYLKSGWIENIDPQSIEDVTINGFQAATATATGDPWTFRLYAVRFGSDVYRFVFATKRKGPDFDRLYRESVGTFRRMTLAEIQATKPLRLKVVSVQGGDTIERMSGRMSVADHPTERFMVINGLQAGQALKPGEQVKIVVE
jgi:predicted Zn-dependent protease